MAPSTPQLQTKRLRRSANPLEYKLYRAALEWDLTEPIIIESRQDLRSESRWRDKVDPYHHQVTNLMTFCRRLPVTLLADDVGLGKTISAGLVASELMARGRVSKILIVCPKLLIPQWKEELDIKFGIPGVEAVGKDLVTAEIPEDGGAVITTYHSARLHFKSIAKAGFDMLILDEAHKLRNLYGVEKPPQVATRIRQALADRQFKYVLMLTATPIQNRLWDLYSLVDLLTVARGHENPFGSEGMFTRNFIADGKTEARQLRVDKRDEFRSIVYGYMSRIRRGDAKLHFPDRKVQLHKVYPSPEELELISLVGKAIQKMNRLSQISILQALTSSPHALAKQLETMASNQTAPPQLAVDVRAVVNRMGKTAKLQGLASLVEELRKENPERWRMVVFTSRRETQTTIEAFLNEQKIPCGLINGDSGSRNQQTIARFKKNPPDINVIVSTEAGSEGVNLQAANVLINYDLPWNPMIVEQRIGRIQRLASEHATVCIFNVILRGTFEEYIVGRLMEKLQMASHAIGDVESLLESAGMDDDDESGGFIEKIRELVVAALVGKNIEEATKKAEQSITEAKVELEREEKNINSMLGGSDGAIDLGPKCPKFPPPIYSMDAKTFALKGLESRGARLSQQSGVYVVSLDGRKEMIRFEDDAKTSTEGTLCRPGAPFFEKLVNGITASGQHQIEDVDKDATALTKEFATKWVSNFSSMNSFRIEEALRCFEGKALLRVRATVAHDSYERLIEVPCKSEGRQNPTLDALQPMGNYLEDPAALRLPAETLSAKAIEDPAISEFCRFYQERLADEINAAGNDDRKRKKLEDDFTPRLAIELVGLEGTVYRELKAHISYTVGESPYESFLNLIPSKNELLNPPSMGTCVLTNTTVPTDCLGRCKISSSVALRQLLKRSEISGRLALPEHMVTCAYSGKQVLSDEVEKSAVTGQQIASSLLKTSAISGKRAEPNLFAQCEFTSVEVLKSELIQSQVSEKKYRNDEQSRSTVSGKTGHKSEFITCAETGQALILTEAERCETTGKTVIPGILEKCELSGKKVLPSELEKCAVTGKKYLRRFMVTSNISGSKMLEQEAIKATSGKFCLPSEAKPCVWSGRKTHPEDLKTCKLTGAEFHPEFIKSNGSTIFEKMSALLDGNLRKTNKTDLWDEIGKKASVLFRGGDCKVEAAELSPDAKCLAVSMEVRTWLGMKVRHAGALYSIQDKEIVGRTSLGKRNVKGWEIEGSRS